MSCIENTVDCIMIDISLTTYKLQYKEVNVPRDKESFQYRDFQ